MERERKREKDKSNDSCWFFGWRYQVLGYTFALFRSVTIKKLKMIRSDDLKFENDADDDCNGNGKR